MNLEKAIKTIAKRAVPMTNSKGEIVPAIYVSGEMDEAIAWLVNRYNDETLNVEGYDSQQEVRRKKIQTHEMRRAEELSRGGFMRLNEFVKASGLNVKIVKHIAIKANAYIHLGNVINNDVRGGSPTLINTDRFYNYLNRMAEEQCYEVFVTVNEAARLTGFTRNEVIQKVRTGEFKTCGKDVYGSYKIYRTSLYKDINFIPRKGALNGKNDNSSE